MPRQASPEMRPLILEAAKILFGRFGFRKTTIEDIAKEAGIGKGSVYLHFCNKEAIFLEVVQQHAMEMLERMKGELKNLSSPSEKLRIAIEFRPASVWKIHKKNFEQDEVIFPEVVFKDHNFYSKFKPIVVYRLILQEVLSEGMEKGEFKNHDPKKIAKNINMVTSAFLPPYRFVQTEEELMNQVNLYSEMMISALSVR